jgi:hypothetical protein
MKKRTAKDRESLVPADQIETAILLLRGQKVMLDRDLAVLYGVETKVLKQAVRRNIERFPPDFMFELTKGEFENWRSQFVTSRGDRMGLRYAPMAFTEQGVAMLSSVLRSRRAVQVNIEIMRAFVRLRQEDKGLFSRRKTQTETGLMGFLSSRFPRGQPTHLCWSA